ncbi:Bug family tripartite tricarboxylate transporter substrate binding protein [Roseomonas populi]|uniref:Tripartite tricarboxylate transporter substrate binding protein n=1 Tax=Roseomonas populi TaxID=3121582 RepID=A0ABT1X4Q0_9PROT|nr:tripartite tricarboxylate transporter substrate binding protein [Roseomonas pecuniae]MCR0983084.1 tripartite tricarboxylate transporter substrate binding protein [Roseomonas pecuniae]
MNRRDLFLASAGGAFTGLLPSAVRAQATWPDRPIRLIVPFPPAGGTDVIAREIAARLGAATGWNIVIDNRPGAGGNIGLEAVAKAAPDGYTLGMGQAANLAINPALYPRMPFDPLRDFALVSTVAVQPNVLVVAKNAPYRTLADLVSAARSRRSQLTAGNAGNGTVGHLAGEIFARKAGFEIISVPYRGASPVVTDLLAGRVDLFFANPLAVKGTLESGDVRALAVTSATRMRALPDVPTIAEAGYAGFEAVNWTGLVAPAGTPAPVISRLNEEVRKALGQDEVVARLAAEGSEPKGSTPEEFRIFLAAEHEKWGRAVRDARVQLD